MQNSVARLSRCVVVTLMLTSCRYIGVDIGCEQAVLTADAAQLEGDVVTFSAQLTREDGDPITDVTIGVYVLTQFESPDYGTQVNGHLVGDGLTDEAGIALGHVELEWMQHRVLGEPTGEWRASFRTDNEVDGVLYCLEKDTAPLPDAVTDQLREAHGERQEKRGAP